MEGALIINPYDDRAVSNAVHRALTMEQDERIERWQMMMNRISRESLTWWRESFITALSEAKQGNQLPGGAC
jgi:trehalose 6-phosphate synthase